MQITNYPTAVAAALSGDNAGFTWLYEQTYRDKYYIALKYMKNEDEAADVLQDAYIRAWEKLDTLDNAFKFPAWLGQIVANTAINAINKKRPMNFSQLEGESDEGDVWEYEAIDERIENQPELAYTDAERSAILKEMVDSLSDEQRMCVMMHYIEEIPIRDIAAQMGCSEGTIKSRLNYARKNLKASADALEKKGYKFFGLAPMALLLLLMKKEVQAQGLTVFTKTVPKSAPTPKVSHAPSSGVEPTAKVNVKVDGSRPAGGAGEISGGSGQAAGGAGKATQMAGRVAGGIAKPSFFGTAGGKALVAALVAAIGVGGGFAAHKIMQSRNAVEQVAEVSEIPDEPEVTATPAPTEQPTPEATPTPGPIPTPTAEEIAIATTEKAYASYYDYLTQNESRARVETWGDSNYNSNWYDTPSVDGLVRSIAFRDLTGDGVPEMVFFDINEKSEYIVRGSISVVSFMDNKIQEILLGSTLDSVPEVENMSLDMCLNYGGQPLNTLLFTTSSELMVNLRYGDAYWSNEYYTITYNPEIQKMQVAPKMHSYEESYGGNNPRNDYHDDQAGKAISKEEFEQRENRIISSLETPLIETSGYGGRTFGFSDDRLAGMTYDQALDFLSANMKRTDYSTSYYSFNMPSAWQGNVDVVKSGDTLKLLWKDVQIGSVFVEDAKDQLNLGDIANSVMWYEEKDDKRVCLSAVRFSYVIPEAETLSNDPIGNLSEEEKHELLKLTSGGRVTLDECREAYQELTSGSGSTDLFFKADDFYKEEIASGLSLDVVATSAQPTVTPGQSSASQNYNPPPISTSRTLTDGQLFPDSSTTRIDDAMINSLSTGTKGEAQLAINELWARHGYTFEDAGWKAYFSQFDWYKPTISKKDWYDRGGSKVFFNSVELDNETRLIERRDG